MGVKRFMPFLQRGSYLFATQTELELICGLPPMRRSPSCSTSASASSCARWAAAARSLIGRRVDLYVPPQPAEVVDVTGAGDLFAAGFLAA